MNVSDFDALNTLVADPDLERLNDLLGEFNLFEALGVVRQELRHSNFLGWLLNPAENHGLGDYALRKFVMMAAREINDPSLQITPAHVSNWELDQAIVLREWRNIDVLIADPHKQFLVLIENKIGTGEHSDQLNRYRQIVEAEYPQATAIYILLSPDGTPPEDANSTYIPLDYGSVYAVIQEIITYKQNTLSRDVLIFLEHYLTMLRRHIMAESDIAQLCREIYARNKRALDLIFEYRPDIASQIKADVLALVKAEAPTFYVDDEVKHYFRFEVPAWKQAANGINILIFRCATQDEIFLRLRIAVRELEPQIRSLIQQRGSPFRAIQTGNYKDVIYTKNLLLRKDYEAEDATLESIREKVNQRWQEFLEHDFPRINEVVMRDILNNPSINSGVHNGTV